MLSRREIIQIATSLANTVTGNIAGDPILRLMAALEILATHAEEPVVFTFNGKQVSWSFLRDGKQPQEPAKVLELLPPVRCLAMPNCQLTAGHEGPCTETVPP